MRIVFLLLFFLLLCFELAGQSDSIDILDESIFQLIEDATENSDDIEFFEQIENLMTNPIDLNTAGKSGLLKIPFINPITAESIITERKKRGRFNSVEDLARIKSIDDDLFILIRPLLKIYSTNNELPAKSPIPFSFNFRSRIVSDIQERAGFINHNYNGSKFKSYNRLKTIIGNFSAGIILEKDPGEKLFNDYFASYVEYKSPDQSKIVLIGDYNLEFGQGLVLWSPYAFSKGSQAVVTPLKRGNDFRPHLSAEENLFFRGGVFSLSYNILRFCAFYSNKNIDASLADDKIITLLRSGYHRTKSEIANFKKVNERNVGINLHVNPYDALRIGFLFISNNFSKEFLKETKYEPSGHDLSFSSFNLNLHFDKLDLNGEISSNGKSFASIFNLFLGFNDNINFLFSYRNYPPSYFNLYSNGFGEYGRTQNEYGFYIGLKIKTDYGRFNIYHDAFNTSAPSYASEFPVSGHDFLVYYENKFFKNSKLGLKFKSETKESNEKISNKVNIVEESRSNYRIELNYKISKKIRGKSRFEICKVNKFNNTESGFLTFQDIRLRYSELLLISSRIIFFETDSYNSRLYEFENDLRGMMTNSPLFGEGIRWYFMANLKLLETFTLSLKYSETYKPLEKMLSSGNSAIEGKLDNRISLQIDYSL